MKRLFALALFLALSSNAAEKPKLLLTIVIDQFRYDYLTRFRGEYHHGLKRLLDDGAVFTDAHHIHAATVTAIGHSTFLSGATPSVSGIIGNEWYDRASKKTVTSVSDDDTDLLGGAAGKKGSSPRRMLVATIPDELKMAGKSAKAIGISIKDRSAILPGGHMADGAYWFDDASGHFVSSTYYAKELAGWVKAANDAGPSAKYADAAWMALDAKPGDNPLCVMSKGGEARACGSLDATPFGNEMLEAFAERAVEGEQLGRHEGTDVLAVSFSSNDYVGHGRGPDSAEVRDISIRTDQVLGKLLDFLDAKLGAGNTLVVLTADHGVAPVPEVNAARKMPGVRLDAAKLKAQVVKALNDRFGEGEWMSAGSYELYLNYATIADKKLDAAEVRRVAADAVRAFPGVARAYAREDIERGNGVEPVDRAVRFGFYGPRSGDVAIVPEPYDMFTPTGTTHGTPYGYDSHVPVIFYGPGIKRGVYKNRIGVTDIAPTLAALFEVETPDGAFGRVLTEALQ
jgi:predicted AlkP superfamily pyrophosphatase or phosphodiesterase